MQRLGRSLALIGTRACFSLKRKNLGYTAGGDSKYLHMSIEDAKKAAGLITHMHIYTYVSIHTYNIQKIYKKMSSVYANVCVREKNSHLCMQMCVCVLPFIERQREWREKRRSARNLTGAWCGDRFKAVDDHVRSGMVVGLGTGSTAFFAVQRVGQKLRTGELSDIICIPTVR